MVKKKKKQKFRKELKKTLRRGSRGQSNKMIYAVAAGLGLIAIIAAILVLGGDKKPPDKEKLMLKAVDYLVKSYTIKEIKALPEENKVILTFDIETVSGNKKDVDFKKMARYAAIRISNEFRDEEINVLLSEIKKKEKDYLIIVKNGKIISEKQLN
ncbi:MAG: hypothetical protein KAT34_13770 [Candidatus Aminicenantes bacterium]|nr:hypothetical protein [Candidatus Aminicenantes bacterium]